MYTCLNSSKIDLIINDVWENVKNSVENNNWNLSSEKTLVFKFMWELAKFVEEYKLKYDFEYVAYDNLEEKDKFLDLLVWTDDNYKIALEFKFPTKSNRGNSNQTETRRNIYKDISRLKYLVDKNINNIKKGYFLFATDEAPYTYKGQKTKYLDLMVYNNYKHTGQLKTNYPEIRILPENFTFEWGNIDDTRNQYKITGLYAWLKPIIIN